MTRSPKGHSDERLIQGPADSQLKDAFAVILLRKAVEPLDGFQVLHIPGRLKFGIDLADVVALKFGVRFHFSA